MFNIVVIGAGQLGSRHLQGLVNLNQQFMLHIVDPYDISIEKAKERINESKPNENICGIYTHNFPTTLPASIDLAIIATTSDIRMKVLEQLCVSRTVNNLILEKVLFQRFADYELAAQLIKKNKIKCWVNCPRRIYKAYIELKEFFLDDPIMHMDVHGGDWGIGCNGIHFIDLLVYLSNRKGAFSFNSHELDTEKRKSKRSGFIEFTGTLQGKYGDVSMNLTSIHNSRAKHLITLRGERKSVVIDEVGGRLWKLEGQGSRVDDILLPYQSQLTGLVAESILLGLECGLTKYEESVNIHLPFLRALSDSEANGKKSTLCPIT